MFEEASDACNSLAWRGYYREEKWEIITCIYLCEVLTTVFKRPIIHNVDLAKIYLFRFLSLSLLTSFKGGNDDLVASAECRVLVAFFRDS